jgi:hypothetical protein
MKIEVPRAANRATSESENDRDRRAGDSFVPPAPRNPQLWKTPPRCLTGSCRLRRCRTQPARANHELHLNGEDNPGRNVCIQLSRF